MKTIEKQKTMKKTISSGISAQRAQIACRQITFASVRPTAGWKLTREGVNEDGHFIRVYTRNGEEVVKDLTTGKINVNNFKY